MIPVIRATFANQHHVSMFQVAALRAISAIYPANSAEALNLNVFKGEVKGLTGASA